MVLENYKSEELDELINKSQQLTKQFEEYCKKHNKEFSSQLLIGEKLFTLEIKIKEK